MSLSQYLCCQNARVHVLARHVALFGMSSITSVLGLRITLLRCPVACSLRMQQHTEPLLLNCWQGMWCWQACQGCGLMPYRAGAGDFGGLPLRLGAGAAGASASPTSSASWGTVVRICISEAPAVADLERRARLGGAATGWGFNCCSPDSCGS